MKTSCEQISLLKNVLSKFKYIIYLSNLIFFNQCFENHLLNSPAKFRKQYLKHLINFHLNSSSYFDTTELSAHQKVVLTFWSFQCRPGEASSRHQKCATDWPRSVAFPCRSEGEKYIRWRSR